MWRLVVFTVVILSSTTTACYKTVQIDNELDSRKALLCHNFLNTKHYLKSLYFLFNYVRGHFRIGIDIKFDTYGSTTRKNLGQKCSHSIFFTSIRLIKAHVLAPWPLSTILTKIQKVIKKQQ